MGRKKPLRTTVLPLAHVLEFCRMETWHRSIGRCSLILGKTLLGMFKRGSILPLRAWTQKPICQGSELPWKTMVSKSKFSTNSWTQLLWVTSSSEHIFFLLWALTYLAIFWYFIKTDSRLFPSKDLIQFYTRTCRSWCLYQLMKGDVFDSPAPRCLRH